MSHVGISLRAEVLDWGSAAATRGRLTVEAVNMGDLGCGTRCPINRGVKNGKVQHVCECEQIAAFGERWGYLVRRVCGIIAYRHLRRCAERALLQGLHDMGLGLFWTSKIK